MPGQQTPEETMHLGQVLLTLGLGVHPVVLSRAQAVVFDETVRSHPGHVRAEPSHLRAINLLTACLCGLPADKQLNTSSTQ